MRVYWISLLLVLCLFSAAVLSAPASKDQNSKNGNSAKDNGAKNSPNKSEQLTKTSSTGNQQVVAKASNEFVVPSSRLDNGPLLKSTAGSKKDNFLKEETSKLGSKEDKATDKELMNMLFDKNEAKLILPKSDQAHRGTDEHHVYKKKAGKIMQNMRPEQTKGLKYDKDAYNNKVTGSEKSHFNVFKVGKHGHRDHTNRHQQNDRRSNYNRQHRTHDSDEKSMMARRWREPKQSERRQHYRYTPRHRRYQAHAERDYAPYSDEHTESFSGEFHGSDHAPMRHFGFDQKNLESAFAPTYQPGGFGDESMGRMGHSGRMFSHVIPGGY